MLCCTGHTKSGVAQNASDSSAVKMPENGLLSEKEWTAKDARRNEDASLGVGASAEPVQAKMARVVEKGVERSQKLQREWVGKEGR